MKFCEPFRQFLKEEAPFKTIPFKVIPVERETIAK